MLRVAIPTRRHIIQTTTKRFFTNTQNYDSLVLGAYTGDSVRLTASKDISSKTKQLIQDQLELSHFKKAGDVRTLYNIGGINQVAVVSLGSQIKDEQESARQAVKKKSQLYPPFSSD